MPLLEVDSVVVRFGGLTALDGITLTVNDGEFVSIIGPNGAGKTTLFNVLAGAQRPSTGTVRFGGRLASGLGPVRMSHLGVARTFQVARPFRSLSVRENIRLAAARERLLNPVRALGLRRRASDVARTVDALLELTALGPLAERSAGELNIGELRRLEVARALAADPKLLLLDEPAAGIGVDGMRPLAGLIAGMRGRRLTVLLVEHHVGFALSLCDRAVVLHEGRILAEGESDAVRTDPRVVLAYLGRAAARTSEGTAQC